MVKDALHILGFWNAVGNIFLETFPDFFTTEPENSVWLG